MVKQPGSLGKHWAWMAALVTGLLTVFPQLVAAQTTEQADNTVQVGDHWTFDTRDEITGSPSDTITQVVTELSPNEIVVRVTTRGKPGNGLIVFNHNWDRIENLAVKWKPNDGQGVRFPLAVGKDWRTVLDARTQTGSAFKMTVLSKAAAQEAVTTAAGMFDTFRIETKVREVAANDPSKIWEYENVGWYAPMVNHWVRRTLVTRTQKRITAKTSEELVYFGRKL